MKNGMIADEVRRRAVAMVLIDGRSLRAVAADLGLVHATVAKYVNLELREWQEHVRGQAPPEEPDRHNEHGGDSGKRVYPELAEVLRLRARIAELERDRKALLTAIDIYLDVHRSDGANRRR